MLLRCRVVVLVEIVKSFVVIEYKKDGSVFGLIISVENIIRNFEAIEKLKEIGLEFSK